MTKGKTLALRTSCNPVISSKGKRLFPIMLCAMPTRGMLLCDVFSATTVADYQEYKFLVINFLPTDVSQPKGDSR